MISCIIVSWNTRRLLAACLDSLRAHPPRRALEVLVIDNASTDGTVEMLRARYPRLRLTANAENLGFAAANNLGVAASRGEYVLFLNADTEVRAGAVEALACHLDRQPGVAAVGPRLVSPDGALQRSCARSPTPWRDLVHLAHLDDRLEGLQVPLGRWTDGLPRSVEVLQGACLLVRRSALDAVGGFDEGYHMYSEEVELCERVRGLGWRLHWLPAAEVMHVGGASTDLAPDRSFLDLYASKVRFYRRNRAPAQVRAFKMVLAAMALPRVAAGALARPLPVRRGQAVVRAAARYRQLLHRLADL